MTEDNLELDGGHDSGGDGGEPPTVTVMITSHIGVRSQQAGGAGTIIWDGDAGVQPLVQALPGMDPNVLAFCLGEMLLLVLIGLETIYDNCGWGGVMAALSLTVNATQVETMVVLNCLQGLAT